MSAPRFDTDDFVETVEEETGLAWTIAIDNPDKLRLHSVNWQFDVVWTGKNWRFELYDVRESYGDDEPRWALGPLRNETEIMNELPSFIPQEVRA